MYAEEARNNLIMESEKISNDVLVYSAIEKRLGLYLPQITVNSHDHRGPLTGKMSPSPTPTASQWLLNYPNEKKFKNHKQ